MKQDDQGRKSNFWNRIPQDVKNLDMQHIL
jgi:hypothetical protein